MASPHAALPLLLLLLLLAPSLRAEWEQFVSIPHEIPLTKVNESISQWLATTCGRSTLSTDARLGTSVGRQHPWAVSILLNGKNKLGGAIISPYHVLTAAHGFVKFNSYESTTGPCDVVAYRNALELSHRVVAVGGDCVRGHSLLLPNNNKCNFTDAEYHRIRTVYVDHNFAHYRCVGGHDWAILELERPLTFGHKVQPICLPFQRQKIDPNLVVVSWGKRNAFEESDPLVHQIPMQYDPACRPPWSDKMPTDMPDYLCAKSHDPLDPDSPRTCHGDSGAGIEQRDLYGIATLVGITSFGSRGCPSNELARFTRVSSYLGDICRLTGVCYTNGR